MVDASYDPVAWLGRKILRRTKRSALEAALEHAGLRTPTRQENPGGSGAVRTTTPECWRSAVAPRAVSRFLSPEWVDAFNEALVDVAVAPPGPEAGLGGA